MKAKPKVRPDLILRQISKRHIEDVFLTEVKNGPTWSAEMLRMDAVAIKKSWANPCVTAYEVKVNRSDFLRDEKWQAYRAYCHRLIFACPTGLIEPKELPDDIGLIYYNADRNTIITKKKAQHRDVKIPWEMFYYLVIARTKSDHHPFFSSQRERLQAWLEDKDERNNLGRTVAGKIGDIHEQLKKANKRIESLTEKTEQLWKVRLILKEAGINDWYGWEDELKKALQLSVPPDLMNGLRRISKEAEDLLRVIEKREAP